MFTPVYSSTEIRHAEQQYAVSGEANTSPSLMELAGLAAAEIARDRLLAGDRKRILILAGPGNNGGDAFVMARHLRHWWFDVTLVFAGTPEKQPGDARQALHAWVASGGKTLPDIPAGQTWDAIADGLFGITSPSSRDLEGKYLDLVHRINRMNLPVLALDIPSGLDSDNGSIRGAAVRATLTVTFIGLKPGLLTHYGTDYCGEIILRKLAPGMTSSIVPRLHMLDPAGIRQLLPAPRAASSHKGQYGSAGIIGGDRGMVGAALLAGTAALKLGAGRVYLGLIADNAPAVHTNQPELMLRPVHELLQITHINSLVSGPGAGTSPDAALWLEAALQRPLPLVLDADALNLVACSPQLAHRLRNRPAPTIITPHPAEAGRLLGVDAAAIQRDRVAAATTLAEQFCSHVVLKGAGSICALPLSDPDTDGRCFINTSGNPGLASAGTGDVLSGMIGAFLSQGLTVRNALLLAVYLHGAAADLLQEELGGTTGMTASELINPARLLLNRLIHEKKNGYRKIPG